MYTGDMNKRASTDGTIRDNHIYGVVVRVNGRFTVATSHYYRRRTSFAGIFTGTYDEAKRLAKLHVNG